MEKSIKLRQNFSPYILHYLELLIENNNLSKAKKTLKRAWYQFPHTDYKPIIKLLSNMLLTSETGCSIFIFS